MARNVVALSECNDAWSRVPSANAVNHNELGVVAAVNVNDIWSVGYHTNASDIRQTLIEHWDGIAWSVVASPNTDTGDNVLTSVAAVSHNDAWAVGAEHAAPNAGYSTLAEHFDGNGWNVVATPSPGTGSKALFSVSGDATNDYWAVGRLLWSSSVTTVAEHWDGTSWSIVSTPSPKLVAELIAVVVLAPNNVWAVGDQSPDDINFQTLVEHYDGTNWTVYPSTQSVYGNGLLFGISGTASDLYAVGAGQSTGFDASLIEHWDGTAWSTVANPPTGSDTDLNSIAYVSSANVWAVGTTFGGTQNAPANSTFVAHWDGNSWSAVASPSNGVSSDLFDVAAVSGSDVWSVGSYKNGSGMLQTLAENYCVPPTITSINPTSGPATGGTNVTIAGTGLVWAKGVNFGTAAAARGGGNSDTQIMATSPPGRGGTVDVRVVYFAGQSAIASPADQFTYVAVAPTAPLNVAAVALDSSAIVYWSPPTSDGGTDITQYTVTPYVGTVAQTPTTVTGFNPPPSTNVTGLTNGTTYTFKVSATNSVGQGPDSDPSNAVTPSPTAMAMAAGPEASSWGKGRLDLFIKGVDGALWHKYYEIREGGWSAWYSHGGTLTSGPTATSWGYGRLDVFYRGSDNTLRHIFYASFIGAWSSEYTHGGALASDPSAVSWGVGRIDVVARGNDGSLQHNDYDGAHGGWLANWESLPGDTIQSGPNITAWGPGRLDVFMRGLDNALHHTYFLNTGWFGWSEQANPQGNVLISDPGAIAWSPGRLDIFARGDHNVLLHKFYDSSVGWSDWFSETLSPTPG